jgi:hypothetical protein
LATLPENSTNRLFVDYVTSTVSGVEHTFYLRYSGADRTGAAAQTLAKDFLLSIGAPLLRLNWKVIRVRTQMAGEQFSFPQDILPALGAILGSNSSSFNRDREADSLTWVGRSPTTGKRAVIALYGVNVAMPATLRTNGSPGGTNFVSTSCNVLNAGAGVPIVVDGTSAVWYYYVNHGKNAYWQKRLRIG